MTWRDDCELARDQKLDARDETFWAAQHRRDVADRTQAEAARRYAAECDAAWAARYADDEDGDAR